MKEIKLPLNLLQHETGRFTKVKFYNLKTYTRCLVLQATVDGVHLMLNVILGPASMAIKMGLLCILSLSVTAQRHYFTFKFKGEGFH